jgi:hypothetical protein
MVGSDGGGRVSHRRGRVALTFALVVGFGLALAPAAFSMFSRAPEGGVMIEDFERYMTVTEIEQFRGYLTEIEAANELTGGALRDDLTAAGTIEEADYDATLNGVAALDEQWPDIEADMTDLLDRMDANLDNYGAVAALPPFDLFPWFFVIPGLLIAGTAGGVLWSQRSGRQARAGRWALVVLGVGVALAPVAFQMFTRAPKGGDMIDDFRPMMTRERVQDVQGYFVTLGLAEGQMRTLVIPAADEAGLDPSGYVAVTTFSDDWPAIVGDFNPMVATMSDNVDNFAAVDALPPFGLFPWFFLIPGLLVAGCGAFALRSAPTDGRDDPDQISISSTTPQGESS